jgi:hypothetical protein
VEIATEAERPQHLVIEPEGLAERHRVAREPVAVAEGVGIARLDGEREGGDDRLGPLELAEQHLDAQKRGETRPQLDKLHRLGEEVVRAGGEAGHPRLEIAHRGEDHHRHQLVARVGLEPRAQLDPAHRAQVHVGQHQVRAHHVERVEGLLRGDRHQEAVAEGAQEAREHLADVGLVLDHQDGRPLRDRVQREVEAIAHRSPAPSTSARP